MICAWKIDKERLRKAEGLINPESNKSLDFY